jgi:hypothetical protein
MALLIVSCAVSREADSLLVPVAFAVNSAFNVSLRLPEGRTENLSDNPSFIAIEEATSQHLFQAMYDEGRGENRGILLTRIWATVHRYSDSELSNRDNRIERIKFLLKQKDTDPLKDDSIGDLVTVDGRDWFPVTLKEGISRGELLVTEVGSEYALIIGVRVFGNSTENTMLREFRMNTLRQIVESVQIQQL